LREDLLVSQLKARLQSVALCDEWTKKMLAKVAEWKKEKVHSSQTFVQNLETKRAATQEKLDKLVSAYIDGDIPKENYLKKKEELLKQKVSLASPKSDFGRMGKNWLEPLRSWILDIQKAKKLSQGDNFEDIKVFVQKVGTNHKLLDKSASFSFSAPWDYVALRKAQSHIIPRRRKRKGSGFVQKLMVRSNFLDKCLNVLKIVALRQFFGFLYI